MKSLPIFFKPTNEGLSQTSKKTLVFTYNLLTDFLDLRSQIPEEMHHLAYKLETALNDFMTYWKRRQSVIDTIVERYVNIYNFNNKYFEIFDNFSRLINKGVIDKELLSVTISTLLSNILHARKLYHQLHTEHERLQDYANKVSNVNHSLSIICLDLPEPSPDPSSLVNTFMQPYFIQEEKLNEKKQLIIQHEEDLFKLASIIAEIKTDTKQTTDQDDTKKKAEEKQDKTHDQFKETKKPEKKDDQTHDQFMNNAEMLEKYQELFTLYPDTILLHNLCGLDELQDINKNYAEILNKYQTIIKKTKNQLDREAVVIWYEQLKNSLADKSKINDKDFLNKLKKDCQEKISSFEELTKNDSFQKMDELIKKVESLNKPTFDCEKWLIDFFKDKLEIQKTAMQHYLSKATELLEYPKLILAIVEKLTENTQEESKTSSPKASF